jgi:hypothetical protein
MFLVITISQIVLNGPRAGVLLQCALSTKSNLHSHLITLLQMDVLYPASGRMPSRAQPAHPTRPALRPFRLRTTSPTATTSTTAWRADRHRCKARGTPHHRVRELHILHRQG